MVFPVNPENLSIVAVKTITVFPETWPKFVSVSNLNISFGHGIRS